MIKILLDNIIFSLQKRGGVSVVWQQHLNRLVQDSEFRCRFIEYNNAEFNFFRQHLQLNQNLIDLKNSKFLFLRRYLNLNSKNSDKHLFHSSYYRTEKGKNVINVTTVHDFTYEHFTKGLTKNVHSWQKKSAINNSEGIICVSQNTKKDLLRFLPHIDRKKIRVIYNGVDNAFMPLDNTFIFQKRHSFQDFNYALYIGDRLAIYKNFLMAIDACALAKMPLVIIGGGNLTANELHHLDLKLGYGNFTSILGASVEELNYYYNKAYCLLYPSLYEGFGIPIIEAQRTGCPVIAVKSSSIPEVLGNQYMAIESPTPKKISEKILELSFNNNLRNETIELGFEKSKDFNWQNTYNQTKEFYKELYK